MLKRFIITLPLALIATFILFLFVVRLINLDIKPYNKKKYVKLDTSRTFIRIDEKDKLNRDKDNEETILALICPTPKARFERAPCPDTPRRNKYQVTYLYDIEAENSTVWRACKITEEVFLENTLSFGSCELTSSRLYYGRHAYVKAESCTSESFKKTAETLLKNRWTANNLKQPLRIKRGIKSAISFERVKTEFPTVNDRDRQYSYSGRCNKFNIP